jgi:hypothetical protein
LGPPVRSLGADEVQCEIGVGPEPVDDVLDAVDDLNTVVNCDITKNSSLTAAGFF